MQDAIQQTKTTTCPNTFQITRLPGKRLIILSGHSILPNIHGEVGINKHLPGVLQLFKLCAAAVSSGFLYKWKKSPSFPFFFSQSHPTFPAFSQEIPQVKILDYVTIQKKQGPYLQQLHTKLSLFMYTGALRLLRVKRMTGCLCNGLQSHDFFWCKMKKKKRNVENETDTNTNKKSR